MVVEISIILTIRFWPTVLGEGMLREKEGDRKRVNGGRRPQGRGPKVAQNIRP